MDAFHGGLQRGRGRSGALDRRPPRASPPFVELGEVPRLLRRSRRRQARLGGVDEVEPAQPLVAVGLEARLALLPVVDDVEPGLELRRDGR